MELRNLAEEVVDRSARMSAATGKWLKTLDAPKSRLRFCGGEALRAREIGGPLWAGAEID